MDSIAVPFLDLSAPYAELEGQLDESYRRVMRSGWYLLGAELQRFEEAFAKYSHAEHAVGTGSGLDALVLGLRALGIGSGDDVIVPSNTYIATWLAVSSVGATPVPVEPDEVSHLITAESVELAITPATRAVIPVHLYGLPVAMEPILAIAEERGIRVLCDAAQSHGATYGGRAVGALGDAVAWSFYPGKNLGAFADAGAVTTNDAEVARRIRRLRNYGSEKKYVNVDLGVNSRLDELQAAFLMDKLAVLDEWNQRRRSVAGRYLEHLKDSDLVLPSTPVDRMSAWHLFVVRTAHRDQLHDHLNSSGVQTIIHYPIPPHRQTAYASTEVTWPDLPVADKLAREVLSLPIGPHMTDGQVDHVIDAVRSFRA